MIDQDYERLFKEYLTADQPTLDAVPSQVISRLLDKAKGRVMVAYLLGPHALPQRLAELSFYQDQWDRFDEEAK